MAKKQTIREMWEEGAEVRTSRSILLEQLGNRFGELPNELSDRILKTEAKKTLHTWLKRVVTANRLEDVGILGHK